MEVKLLQKTDTNPAVYTFTIINTPPEVMVEISDYVALSIVSFGARYSDAIITQYELDTKYKRETLKLINNPKLTQSVLCRGITNLYNYNIVVTIDSVTFDKLIEESMRTGYTFRSTEVLVNQMIEAKSFKPKFEYIDGISNMGVAISALPKHVIDKASPYTPILDLVKRLGVEYKVNSIFRHLYVTLDVDVDGSIEVDKGVVADLQTILYGIDYDDLPLLMDLEPLVDAYYENDANIKDL